MARITVEGCLDKVHSRFELILHWPLSCKTTLNNQSRTLWCEEDDKPTIVALREIEEGLINNEILERTLKKICCLMNSL